MKHLVVTAIRSALDFINLAPIDRLDFTFIVVRFNIAVG